MENKFCRYCVKTLPIDNFDEGFKTCKKCLEYKRANRDKHRDKVNEKQRNRYGEDEEYRKHKQEYNKTFQSKIISCSVCNKSMSQQYYYEHIKTQKHKHNLEMNDGDKNKLEVMDWNDVLNNV